MGGVWSVINSMVGVDDRDLQLTVTMIREHHAAIVQARETGTAVPWQRMWHQTAANVPYQTEWGMMGHILESAPLPDYVALAIEGVPDMLADIEAFQADPNSQYAQRPPCMVCHQLAYDENVNWDGPVGTRRFFSGYGVPLTFGGAPAVNPPWGRNTGMGRNRRIYET
jgi:hypothetical protein